MRWDPIVALSAIALVTLTGSALASGAELSVDDRVRIQARIERLYHDSRTGQKAPFEEVLGEAVLREMVSRYLRLSSALETLWGAPVTADDLRAEARRIERSSQAPARLAELYAAVEYDAFLFQECVARATLVERLARSYFASDARFGDTSWDVWSATFEPDPDSRTVRPVAEPGRLPLTLEAAPEDCPPPDSWTPGALDDRPDTRFLHTAIWTGSEMIVWGGTEYLSDRLGFRYDPLTDTWDGMSSVGAPVGRNSHTAVWTGSEVIVWGGTSAAGDGGRYDPVTDQWLPMTSVGAPTQRRGHTAAWTGAEMIVWGGEWGGVELGDGGRYDPASDSWSSVSSAAAPSARSFHSGVWAGTVMVIWGGVDAAGLSLEDGGLYDPLTDAWSPVSTSGPAPSSRSSHSAVWTGTEMIVWGGDYTTTTTSGTRDDGARYDPAGNSWSGVNHAAPTQRGQHTAIWTGAEMIVWGGDDRNILRNDGARYDPGSNSWTALPATTNSPSARNGHTAVWDGTRMLVFGGGSNSGLDPFADGARYDPGTDAWSPISEGAGPEPRMPRSSTVWTGAEMIVWGGVDSNTGSRYDPVLDQWTPTSTIGAPEPRAGHTALWTGTEMLVWGGGSCLQQPFATGGRYDPVSDSWMPTSTTASPAGRVWHTAVWSGTEMIVWGGCTDSSFVDDTGGRYDPVTDTWNPTTTTNVAERRHSHSAVWTGTEMIVWGGADSGGFEHDSGGRYDPWTDSWTWTSTIGAPPSAQRHAAVWSGEEMIVWGGFYEDPLFFTGVRDSGGRYDPISDTWTPTTGVGVPSARGDHGGVWTGSELLVWGGTTQPSSGSRPRSGGRYDPGIDLWTATNEEGAPPGRGRSGLVFSGEYAMLWGGGGEQGDTPRADGSQYAVDTDRDGVANACDDDDDDDSVPDAADCAPLDALATQPPFEVSGVVLSNSAGVHLSWNPQTQARYDVMGGGLSDLRGDGGVVAGFCVANDVIDSSWQDLRPGPTPGDGHYYLIRAQNGCGVGALGTTSSGIPRLPGELCP